VARPVLGRTNAAGSAAGRSAPGREEPDRRIAHLDRDRALVEAARRDPLQFDALYRRYLAQVYSYAFYELGNHHEAEDVTERTFLAALANLGRFDERARPADGEGASTFRVWLFQIARNAVSNQRRGRRRHPEASLETAAALADASDVEAAAATRDEAAAAWRAVARLPMDRRRAVVLRFVEEMSTAEIAGVLGRTEGAVRVLIHRALRTVARDLGERGDGIGEGREGGGGRDGRRPAR
jgi:RNA polymerase sigma-70 factor (ECF subfamily)